MTYFSELFYSLYRRIVGGDDKRTFTHYLACYLKCEDRILLEKTHIGDKEVFLPVVIPVSPVCDIHSESEKVQRVMGKMFCISSEQVDMGYRSYSLFPLESSTYYIVTINLSGEQSYKLESNSEYNLMCVPQNYLSLNSDINYFYQIYCMERGII